MPARVSQRFGYSPDQTDYVPLQPESIGGNLSRESGFPFRLQRTQMEKKLITNLASAFILRGYSADMTRRKELVTANYIRGSLQECENAQHEAMWPDNALEIDYPVLATGCVTSGHQLTQTGAPDIG